MNAPIGHSGVRRRYKRRAPKPLLQQIAMQLRILKRLRDLWVKTPEWQHRNRDEILKRLDEFLNSEWATKFLTKE